MEEDFFYYDTFCSDISDLMMLLDIEEELEAVNELPGDWSIRIELTDLEPVCTLDVDDIYQFILDQYEDRLGEHDQEKTLKTALRESIDFEKLNQLLPKLYYPNGTFETITKQDLVVHFS